MNAHANIKRISRDDYETCAEYRDRLVALQAEALGTLCASEGGERALDCLHGALDNLIQEFEGDMESIPRANTYDPSRADAEERSAWRNAQGVM